ncbi:MAG: ADP-ribosylation factor-like protein [Promethearchaeota archaeon]
MKLALVGLSGCGKTSIYLTTFLSKAPHETKTLSPTVMYEIHNHPYLGLEVNLFDFGGQETYRQSYLENPDIFVNTRHLIFVVDLHDKERFEMAKDYFGRVLEICKDQKPLVYLFWHKFDVEEFPRPQLDKNLKRARETIIPIFEGWDTKTYQTSIYKQEELTHLIRDILLSDYEILKQHIDQAGEVLKEIPTKIIVSDISGNTIVHNVPGIGKGLQLRSDIRNFITAANILRESFFATDSASFNGKASNIKKSIELHVFKYILAVLAMHEKELSEEGRTRLDLLLSDTEIFADLVIRAHEGEV